MMEQFKELHKTVEQLRTSGLSTGEMKKVSRSFQHLLFSFCAYCRRLVEEMALVPEFNPKTSGLSSLLMMHL